MPSGRNCCFDADPVKDGKYIVAAWDVKGVEFANNLCMAKFDPEENDPQEARYNSHFATCPNASEHSKKGSSHG